MSPMGSDRIAFTRMNIDQRRDLRRLLQKIILHVGSIEVRLSDCMIAPFPLASGLLPMPSAGIQLVPE